nr:MAG TPA: hypothetical protein [Caudoviricetes sp.]
MPPSPLQQAAGALCVVRAPADGGCRRCVALTARTP